MSEEGSLAKGAIDLLRGEPGLWSLLQAWMIGASEGSPERALQAVREIEATLGSAKQASWVPLLDRLARKAEGVTPDNADPDVGCSF